LYATERHRDYVVEARFIWHNHRQPAMRLEPHRLYFIDETSVNTKMIRAYGWGAKSERLVVDAPFGHWLTQTFIAALRCDGLCAPWVLNHPMCRESFDLYIETQLAPILKSGDIVVLDNLAAHKSAKAQQILQEKGAWMLFLPPYSPDLNPIEMAFSKLKSHLKTAGMRTFDGLINKIGDICDMFSPQECFNYFKKTQYAPN